MTITRIQLRRGTAAQWTAMDPVLAQGEVGVETDTDKFKIGDGTTAWTALEYAAGAGGTAGVASFNTRTGAVGLMKADVTATGLTAADVGADAAGAAAAAQNASLQKSANLSDLLSAATARTSLGLGSAATQNTSAFDAAGAAAAVEGLPLGLTGATAATRYVGGTTSGAPTTGTFLKGDFVIDQTGAAWVCTTAGSPGTWTQLSGSGASGVSSVTAADTSIVVGGTGSAPILATATLDVIATDHPPAAAVPMNAKKITGLANGAAASDAAAFGQIPTSASSIGGLLAANNLSDVANVATAQSNLGLVRGSANAVQGLKITDASTQATSHTFLFGPRTDTASVTFPVAVIQPANASLTASLDVAPSSGASNFSNNGLAWMDVCDAPVIDASPYAGHTTRIGAQSTFGEVSTRNFGGADTIPLKLDAGWNGTGNGKIHLGPSPNGSVILGYDGTDVFAGTLANVPLANTTGFFYFPKCNGTPTGVPVYAASGIPCLFDTSTNKLWIYNGGWKASGAFA